MKRILTILYLAVMIVTLSACSTKSNTDYSNQTISGQVTSINGTKVTLQLGELSTPERPKDEKQTDDQMPSEKPEDDSQTDGQTPPEKPEGDDQSPSEKPESDGQTPPENPDGKEKNGKQMRPGGKDRKEFSAGDETATFDLDGAEIQMERRDESQEGTIDDISENSILVIEIGDNNKIKTVTIKEFGGQNDQEIQETASNENL